MNVCMLLSEVAVAMSTIFGRVIRQIIDVVESGVPNWHEPHIDTFGLEHFQQLFLHFAIFMHNLSLKHYCVLHTRLNELLHELLRGIMGH